MTNRYAHELQAACEAVKLAARLCTVRLCSISMEFEMLSADGLTTEYRMLQRLQLQLKAGEKQDKNDDSPVTIADYGNSVLSCVQANKISLPVCITLPHAMLQVARR